MYRLVPGIPIFSVFLLKVQKRCVYVMMLFLVLILFKFMFLMFLMCKTICFIVLSFIGNMSGVIKTGLSKALQKRLSFCKLRVILTLKMFYQNLYNDAKYTHLRAEAAVLPILAKTFGIRK